MALAVVCFLHIQNDSVCVRVSLGSRFDQQRELMNCGECERLSTAKEEYWHAYQKEKLRSKVGLFKELKSTEEIDHLLEEYKIASARLRYHLAVKHTDEGHRVSEADLKLLGHEDGPV